MDDLLKPELSIEESGRSLYSSRALFFTGFFGGLLAIVLLSALNSRILNRLRIDLIFCFIAIVILFVFLYFAIVVPEGVEGYKWLYEFRRTNPVYKYGPRFLSLIFWAISYASHRQYHKTMALVGLTPLKPWRAAISCAIIGGIIQMGIIFSVLGIKGVL